jgi:DNA end-binding protein Ku
MPTATWRGTVSFGLVAIPVRMYKATEYQRVSFRLLCQSCGSPIQNRRWCPNEEKQIGWNDVVRGFEVSRDDYVEITDSDVEHLPLPSTDTIDITEVVDDSEIDSAMYLDQAYFLEPEPAGVRPYFLLKKALETRGRSAVGKLAIREREHLCRLSPREHVLVLNTLHWPDEIRSSESLRLPEADVEIRKRELDMALALIDNLTAAFEPSRYKDEYREALLQVVEAKQAHKRLPERRAPARDDNVVDLMAALKAAVAQTNGSRRNGSAAAKASKTAPATAAPRNARQPAQRRKAS